MDIGSVHQSHNHKHQDSAKFNFAAQAASAASFGDELEKKLKKAEQPIVHGKGKKRNLLEVDDENIAIQNKIYDPEEDDESVMKTVQEMKKKLKSIIELERRGLGL